jgi:glycosyltransferase involved in cell wall biosynthesis
VVVATWWETAEWVNALGPDKGAKAYFIQHHEVFPYLPVARCHATYRLPLHKIVIARWLKDLMREHYADDVVDLVPNSVDRRQFFSAARAKQSVPTAGFLYSTTPFKGLDVLLAALKEVRKNIPGLRLICFGAEAPSAAMALPEKAEFCFSPPQDQLRNLYSQCDVWITASRSEGFNLPAMEAMACRTPVVSTRTGWPEEAIETGKNGVLVEVDDVAGLARGVERILSLPAGEWERWSQCAYQTTRSGSWEESTRKFESALLHACRRSMNGEIGGRSAFMRSAACPQSARTVP